MVFVEGFSELRKTTSIGQSTAIVIDSTSTDDERTEAIDGFAEDIRNMSGERIVATAVVWD